MVVESCGLLKYVVSCSSGAWQEGFLIYNSYSCNIYLTMPQYYQLQTPFYFSLLILVFLYCLSPIQLPR